MDKKVSEKVWELYQKGWSYERIALELELQRDEVEKQCKKKLEEKEALERKERDNDEEVQHDQEDKEDLAKEIEESFTTPFKKLSRM